MGISAGQTLSKLHIRNHRLTGLAIRKLFNLWQSQPQLCIKM